MLIEPYDDQPPPGDSSDFLARLRLKQVDRDVFTGWCHAGSPLRAFGGQVAAQALVAAGATVEDAQRRVHSLHAYFLRAGKTTAHIVYMVDRPRDGRSFTTRRVRAIQFGETIFTMSVSFATNQSGPAHQRAGNHEGQPTWWAALPKPTELLPEDVYDHISLAADTVEEDRARALAKAGFPQYQLLDLRVIAPALAVQLSNGVFDRMVWVQANQPLSDEQLPHVCAMTYFSDLTLVGTALGHHGGRRASEELQIASIDHAMWYHNPFRADDWMLLATDSPVSGFGRGFARGQFYRSDGVLAASVAQEVLLRDPAPR